MAVMNRKDILKPNQCLVLEFDNPKFKNQHVVYEVSSSGPVNTYLVDDMGHEDFMDGKTPSAYSCFKNRRNHQDDMVLPKFSRFHLIIDNKCDEQVNLSYVIRVR